jgi:hypothetical protein
MSVRSMNEYILTQLDELISTATDVALTLTTRHRSNDST